MFLARAALMSMPRSAMASMAKGSTVLGSKPALHASKRSGASSRKKASAI